jgi:hypothetical protein
MVFFTHTNGDVSATYSLIGKDYFHKFYIPPYMPVSLLAEE